MAIPNGVGDGGGGGGGIGCSSADFGGGAGAGADGAPPQEQQQQHGRHHNRQEDSIGNEDDADADADDDDDDDDSDDDDSDDSDDDAAAAVRLIRSADLVLASVPLPDGRGRVDVPVTLSLWDGPSRGGGAGADADSGNGNSDASRGGTRDDATPPRRGKIGSGASPGVGVGGPSLLPPVPLSLTPRWSGTAGTGRRRRRRRRRRRGGGGAASRRPSTVPPDLTSSLSALLGIGQHLTLTPKLDNDGGEGGGSGDGTTTGGGANAAALLFESTVLARLDSMGLLSAQTLGSGAGPESELSMLETLDAHHLLFATASLSAALQSVLNAVVSACDCRFPSFGIWGRYDPAAASAGAGTKAEAEDGAAEEVVGAFFDVPTWLGGMGSTGVGDGRVQEGGDAMAVDATGRPSPRVGDKRKRSHPFRNPRQAAANGEEGPGRSIHLMPPLLSGLCHPGPAPLSASASFVVHVIPPGYDRPDHLETLNGLARVLLHHCAPVGGPQQHGTVAVSGARHVYAWRPVGNDDNIRYRRDADDGLWDLMREEMVGWRYLTGGDGDGGGGGQDVKDDAKAIAQHRRQCEGHAVLLIRRAAALGLPDRQLYHRQVDSLQEKSPSCYPPLWGPDRDPLDQAVVATTWDGNSVGAPPPPPGLPAFAPPDPSHDGQRGATEVHVGTGPTEPVAVPAAPLLTLPLKIRSSHALSSADLLELESTLLSTIFDPRPLPPAKFTVGVMFDHNAKCSTLSANNRCVLAGLMRVAGTCEKDTLIGHLCQGSVLEAFDALEEEDPSKCASIRRVMDAAKVSLTTRRLVEVMDWKSMADALTSYRPDVERAISLALDGGSVLDGGLPFPSPPVGMFRFPDESGTNAGEVSGVDMSGLFGAAPPGRLLSILFASMASLRTPSAMAAAWMAFVEELRARWERRESLPNLGRVEGLDDNAFLIEEQRRRQKQERNSRGRRELAVAPVGRRLGNRANGAAFVNSSEPDPDLDQCLIAQKLQVFNIGNECVVAAESEEIRRSQQHADQDDHYEKEWHDDEGSDYQPDGSPCPPKESCSGSVASTDVANNAGDSGSKGLDKLHDGLPKADEDRRIVDREVMDEDANDEDVELPSVTEGSSVRDDFHDAVDDDGGDQSDNENAATLSLAAGSPPKREIATNVVRRQSRRGARCPVQGVNLIASGDQLYAPYLQRAEPLCKDEVAQRRVLFADTGGRGAHSSSSIQDRLEVAHRIQKSKLLSDMRSFKAANPGAIFQDFTSWYGNPDNPLEEYKEGERNSSPTYVAYQSGESGDLDSASDAIHVLTSIRNFWSECWDEAAPCPASEQQPLYDAFSSVAMAIHALETAHPAYLLNQILAVNLSTALFALRAEAGPAGRVPAVRRALDILADRTEVALLDLAGDRTGEWTSFGQKRDCEGLSVGSRFVSTETVASCEAACNAIAEVEILLSRAMSLLHKFSGEYSLVQELLVRGEGEMIAVDGQRGRKGILNAIRRQQHQMGVIPGEMELEGLPSPSVREYVLRSHDLDVPCQLSVRLGDAHGIEDYDGNGGLILALSKCQRE